MIQNKLFKMHKFQKGNIIFTPSTMATDFLIAAIDLITNTYLIKNLNNNFLDRFPISKIDESFYLTPKRKSKIKSKYEEFYDLEIFKS